MKPIFIVLALFGISLSNFASANPPSLSRIRVLLVASATDKNIGQSTVDDVKAMAQFLAFVFDNDEMYPKLKGRATLDVLGLEKEVTPKEIMDHYRNLDVRDDDVLFFYYSGHGAFNDDLRESVLSLTGGDLSRTDLKRLMVSRSIGGLRFLITDMCSGWIDKSQVPSAATASTTTEEMFEYLFFQSRGTLDITAASPGQLAWGYMFTPALLQTLTSSPQDLDASHDGQVSWKEVIKKTKQTTSQIFLAYKQARGAQASQKLRQQKNLIPFTMAEPCHHPGSINDTKVFHNIQRNNRKGMNVELDLEIHGYQGKEVVVTLYFYNNNGKALFSSDRNYASKSGRVASWDTTTPKYKNTTYNGFKIFIPYNEIEDPNAGPGRNAYYVQAEIQDGATNEVIGHSPQYPFGITP